MCTLFFQPHRVVVYVLRTTRLLANYDTVYLHLKKTNTTKIEKILLQESHSLKLTLDPLSIEDWPTFVVLSFWHILLILPSSLSIGRCSSWPSVIGLTCQPINRGELLWPSASPVDHSSLFNRPITLLSHRLLLLMFLTCFFQKMVSTHAPSFGVNNLLIRNFLELDIFLIWTIAESFYNTINLHLVLLMVSYSLNVTNHLTHFLDCSPCDTFGSFYNNPFTQGFFHDLCRLLDVPDVGIGSFSF
jgi:hypothetical protein